MNGLPSTLHADDGAAYVLPQVSPDMPADVAEGIYRRRLTATTGRCPCGATMNLSRAERRKAQRTGKPVVVQVQHEDGCPAITTVLRAAVRAWQAGVTR